MERGIGDNSAAYGEELRGDIETILSDDHKKLFHFAKWHIEDYILGTEGMGLEHEGAYMRFLMRLYQRGKPLPDDDRYMSTLMRLSIRVWRRVKAALIEIGKITVKCGCLTNTRFERERIERADQLRKQAQAAREQHAKRRAGQDANHKVPAKFGGSSEKVFEKLFKIEAKKSNEINDTSCGRPPIARDLKRQEIDIKDSVPNGTGAEAPAKSLREMVWDEGLDWLRPRAFMTEAKLRGQVGRWVRDHDPGVVLNAIAVAQKENPVSVMTYIEGVLRRREKPAANGNWREEADQRSAEFRKLLEA